MSEINVRVYVKVNFKARWCVNWERISRRERMRGYLNASQSAWKALSCYRSHLGPFPQLSINLGSALWLVIGLSGSLTGNRRINSETTILHTDEYTHTCSLWWENRGIAMEGRKEWRGNKAADCSEGGQMSRRRTVRWSGSNPPLHCVVTSAS